ncbi:XP_014777560.1PREDICTED: uncharacterized protein LOC106874363 [Octopus vulgaris]|uniref:XP_014777560.1PREDICTED: uncharacterized protein LOC106874363 n=1 Tax=Octopus vulgaris TaxID=6645 RepID=A0AA36AH34_OCTVU|nr:XP_014777560.1PREDICTED: uncharacterized protein LOC106874363 [Octopus vulgaris]
MCCMTNKGNNERTPLKTTVPAKAEDKANKPNAFVSLFAVIQITVCSSDVTGTIQHRLKRNTTDNNQVILRIAQPPHRQIKCIYPEVPCSDSRRCYHSIYERCNGEEDCYDGSDEFGCRTPENEIDEQKERPPRRKDNFPELFRKLVIGVMVILVLLGVLACVCHFQKYTMRAVSWDSDSLDSVSSFSAQPEPQDTTGGNAICLTDFSFQKPAEELSTMTTLDPFPPSEDTKKENQNLVCNEVEVNVKLTGQSEIYGERHKEKR